MTMKANVPTEETSTPAERKPKGFAGMTKERIAEISAKGGRAAHAAGRAHRFTSDEAESAGRKGGFVAQERRRKIAESK